MILSINNVFYGLLYMGLVLLPFSTGKDSSFGVVSYGLPVLLVAAFLFIVKLAHGQVVVPPKGLGIAFISVVYVLLMLSFSFIAPEVVSSLARSVPNALGCSLFLFLLTVASEDEKDRLLWMDRIEGAMICSGIILALYFLAHLAIAVRSNSLYEVMYSREVGGLMALPWGTSNSIAAILVFPLIMVISRNHRNKSTIAGILTASLMIAAIMATESRTGIIVLLYLFSVHALANGNYRSLILLFVVAGALLVFLYSYDEQVSQAIFGMRFGDAQSLSSAGGRTERWQESIEYIRRNVLTPVGYYGSLSALENSSHNIFLTTLIEMGVAGIGITLALFTVLIRYAVDALRRSADAARKKTIKTYLVGLTAILLNLQVEDPNYIQQYIIYFWIFAGAYCLGCLPSGTAEYRKA